MASPSSIPPLPDHVRIRIMSPGADVPPNFTIDIPSSSTIDDLKHQIQAGIDVKPTPDQQRLIYRGKVLEGGATVQTAVVGAAGAINVSTRVLCGFGLRTAYSGGFMSGIRADLWGL